MSIEAVTTDVKGKMEAANASVLCEDGLLQHVCEHKVRHPVARLQGQMQTGEGGDAHLRHECVGQFGGAMRVERCECCAGLGCEPLPEPR